MRLRYLGGRSRYEVSYERKSYHFTPENNHILDIQDQKIVNYIFGLPNRAEFEAVMEEARVSIPFNGTGDSVDLKPKEEPKIIKKAGRPKKGGK